MMKVNRPTFLENGSFYPTWVIVCKTMRLWSLKKKSVQIKDNNVGDLYDEIVYLTANLSLTEAPRNTLKMIRPNLLIS